MLPSCLGWHKFVEAWKPGDLILTSRQKVRDRAQMLLFQKHKESFPDTTVPLLYHPKDTRKQNIQHTLQLLKNSGNPTFSASLAKL